MSRGIKLYHSKDLRMDEVFIRTSILDVLRHTVDDMFLRILVPVTERKTWRMYSCYREIPSLSLSGSCMPENWRRTRLIIKPQIQEEILKVRTSNSDLSCGLVGGFHRCSWIYFLDYAGGIIGKSAIKLWTGLALGAIKSKLY